MHIDNKQTPPESETRRGYGPGHRSYCHPVGDRKDWGGEPVVPAIAVPIPFLTRQVGLGETISGVLSGLFGVQPCGGCKQRAEVLDREVRFVPWG